MGYTVADRSHVYGNSTINGYTTAYNGQYTFSNSNWSFLGGDGGGSWNVAPRSHVGSIYFNDGLIRSTNGGAKWLSDIANAAGGVTLMGSPAVQKFGGHGTNAVGSACFGSVSVVVDTSGNGYLVVNGSYYYGGNVASSQRLTAPFSAMTAEIASDYVRVNTAAFIPGETDAYCSDTLNLSWVY